MSLTDQDIERISDKLLEGVQKKAAEYYVDRKTHANHHRWVGGIIKTILVASWALIASAVAAVLTVFGFLIKAGVAALRLAAH